MIGDNKELLKNFCEGKDAETYSVPENAEQRDESHEFVVLNCTSFDIFVHERNLRLGNPPIEEFVALGDVQVVGDSFIIKNGKFLLNDKIYPKYLEFGDIKTGYGNLLIEQKKLLKRRVELDQVYVFSHPHARHYGHFITECLPKLLSIKYLYESGYKFPIYVGYDEPEFVREFVHLIIPKAELVPNDNLTYVVSKRAIVPVFYKNYLYPVRLREEFRKLSDEMVNLLAGGNRKSGKLFISRSKLKSKTNFRELSNQAQLERISSDRGYEIYHPQCHSIIEQIYSFGDSRIIVGEYASALHNAIFSPPNTVVLSFNWINLVQQAIGINFGHKNIFIFPDSKQAVLAPTKSKSGAKKIFSINTHLFTNTLKKIEDEYLSHK